MNIAFLDTETTGLDPTRHAIWEIAIIKRSPATGVDTRYLWQLNPDTTTADPKALEISRYHERNLLKKIDPLVSDHRWEAAFYSEYTYSGGPGEEYTTAEVVLSLASILRGCHLVGAVPSFDDAFLKALFREYGATPTWHYHLIDVETLAAGYLAGRGQGIPALPWDSEALSLAVGVEVYQDTRHTALGDAEWARDIYDAVTAGSQKVRDLDDAATFTRMVFPDGDKLLVRLKSDEWTPAQNARIAAQIRAAFPGYPVVIVPPSVEIEPQAHDADAGEQPKAASR